MWGNSATAWGTGSKAFHWLLAFMILCEVPLGYLMANTYGPALKNAGIKPLHDTLSMLHHTNGFCILVLSCLRLGWRANHPTPGLPPSLAAYQRTLARLNQAFLYSLLIVIPLTGWAAVSVLADSEQFGKTAIWFFGTDHFQRMPLIPPKAPNDPTGYRMVGGMHRVLVYIGGVLLSLHVVGAFWHHLVRRDGVLLAIWPGTGAPTTER